MNIAKIKSQKYLKKYLQSKQTEETKAVSKFKIRKTSFIPKHTTQKIQSKQSFGPLSEFKTNQNPMDYKAVQYVSDILKTEKEINKWVTKLKKGYSPNLAETIQIQQLIYNGNQKIELLSKVLESINNSIKTLERMQL